MNRFYSRLPAALLLSALLAVTIALIEPAKSAIGNWNEIVIGISPLLARLAMPFAATFVGIAAFAVLLTAIAPRRAVPILVALYVALWAQGSLFVWEYGTFDGSPIDWSEHSGKALLELAFWAAALALAFTKHEWIRRRLLPITAIVFALQLAALAGQVHQNAPFPKPPDSGTSVVHAQGATDLSLIQSVSRFSRDLNVIIVVLDSLQSDFFSEAIRNPELRAAMPPGFTYFRNAVSLYPWTTYSLQSMLTSRAIPDNLIMKQWRRETAPKSLPTRLAEQGFDAVVATFAQSEYREFRHWPFHLVLSSTLPDAGSARAAWREDVSNMFALGLFRLSPHFLKPRIYDDGRWRISRLYPPRETERDPRILYETRTDLAVFDELIASATADDTVSRFRFLHFYGAHNPYTVDEDCRYPSVKTKNTREDAIATTHCILSRLFEFFHKLDEIGVYDQSLIFVVADHGTGIPLDVSVASPGLPESGVPHEAANNQEIKRIYRPWHGVPLFLAKPIGDRDSLRISDLPVSLCDLPKSVFDALSIEHDFKCESIFSARSPRQAPRMHYRYPRGADERRARGLLPGEMGFEKFAVVGHSWLPESWIPFAADTE